MPIVALRGLGDATVLSPVPQVAPTSLPVLPLPGSNPSGFDPVIVAAPPAPPLPPLTVLFWLVSLSTVGYIFWATLQPKKRQA
jgi:hypothetical protein